MLGELWTLELVEVSPCQCKGGVQRPALLSNLFLIAAGRHFLYQVLRPENSIAGGPTAARERMGNPVIIEVKGLVLSVEVALHSFDFQPDELIALIELNMCFTGLHRHGFAAMRSVSNRRVNQFSA